jgi:DNA-binding MarR family transcriptional regulator
VANPRPRRPADSTLSPLYYVFAASQQAKVLLGEALAGAELGPEEYAVYSAARELGPVTPTELARHLGMPVTTALDMVRAMVRRQHVEKVANPRDGRSYLVQLTPEGHRVHDETEELFARADIQLEVRLGGRRQEVIDTLVALLDAGEAAIDDLRAAGTDRAG